MDKLEYKLKKWARRYIDDPVFVKEPEQVQQVKKEFDAYFHKEQQHFTFGFTFHGTPFQKQVWQALYETITYGEITTYKTIADRIGKPKAVRADVSGVNKYAVVKSVTS